MSCCSELFHDNVAEIPQELNCCFSQLADGRFVLLDVAPLKVAEPVSSVK